MFALSASLGAISCGALFCTLALLLSVVFHDLGLLKVLKGSASGLLLDEVTANLDPLSEASLLSGIREVTKRHRVATLFVTHRISNAKIADKVLVVKSGAVIERGTHDQLCDMEGGVYQKLLAASDSF